MCPITYIIIGASLAGTSAAEALRGEGFDGRLILIGDEPEAPYERPPLSKQRLRGEVPQEDIFLRAATFYDLNRIELRLGVSVLRIDPTERYVELAGGERLDYKKLLIATGAVPRLLKIPGGNLQGVHYLRTSADCERIRKSLEGRPRVLVIGTGFIGCEVAASLRQIDCAVALVGHELPLQHVLGSEVGKIYASYHRSQGIDLRTDLTVFEFLGSGRLERARLSDGSMVPCDLAILGVGVSPAVGIAPPGMQLENGILTDEFCRTNVDNIFAAGDVACSWRPRLNRRVRLEHFDNAQLQGAAAGRVMSGKMQPYDPIPFFWSDQFKLTLQYYGLATDWDNCVLRGKPEEYSFAAFYLRDGRIDAVCNVNRPHELSAAKLLLGQTGVDARYLMNDSVDLIELARKQTQHLSH